MTMRLVDLLQAVQSSERSSESPKLGRLDVRDLTHDSHLVAPGTVFVALPGRQAHGIEFADDAIARGAVAIITDETGADRYRAEVGESPVPVVAVTQPRVAMAKLAARLHANPSEKLAMLGVTGTNGKTSVTHLVQAALAAGGISTGIVGTLGTSFAGEQIFAGTRTTPESSDLQRILARMVTVGARAVAMEVSSIAVEEHRVDDIIFDAVGFTGLSHDHLDYHGSMQAYFDAKARLFTPDHARSGVVVVDDSWGQDLARQSEVPIVTVSTTEVPADWMIRRIGGTVEVVGPESARVDLPLDTGFVAANALLSIALAYTQGISVTVSAEVVSRARVPGRMERVARVDDIDFVVDYAHSPDSIDKVVGEAVRNRESRGGRVIVVLGAGGDRDQQKRPGMGRSAAVADVVIVTDDNPRYEDPAEIRRAVRRGAEGTGVHVEEIGSRSQAIRRAVELANPRDVVLVLGKGHESSQEIAGEFLPFDDRAVLASFVRDRFGSSGIAQGGE